MKKAFICALLAGSLTSLCYAEQNDVVSSAKRTVSHSAATSQALPAFGPVLLPQSGRHSASLPKSATPAPQTTAHPDAGNVQQESLGEIARRYRAQRKEQPTHAIREMGMQ